jgi:predicted metalloprotease with PDZ domain
VLLELLRPREGHDYNFSQEHDTSGTFSLSVDRATNAHSADSHNYSALFNYAHHMAHSWVPKRVWGVGYRPFNWELPPVIETIWFNEGFGRYAGMQALAAGLPDEERGRDHSLRSASNGSANAARRAGISVATDPANARTIPAATMAKEFAVTDPKRK